MTAQLSPTPVQKFFDNNGFPLFNGKLYTYQAGTTAPQATYVDSTQTTQNTNPITLNYRGECNLWLDPTLTYKFVLQDIFGNTIWTVDNIQGGFTPSAIAASLIPKPTNTWTLGDSTHSWAQLYLGSNASPALDTVSGIIGYYPRTPAEIAALVTPTSYAYAPGDIRRYGGVGDGVTDSTTALVNWAKCTTAGLELTLQPGGVYMITPNSAHNIIFDGKTNFRVSGNGATIKVANAGSVAGNNEVFFIRNCQDAVFENFTVDGNLANRTPVISTTSNFDCRGDNGTGTGICARVTFRKVRSINAVMDGLTLQTATESVQSSYPTDILFEDCEFNNAWRNGASIVASLRCTIRGGRAVNCGTTASGTAPRDGVDVEPNSTTTFANTDLLIDGMEFSSNAGFGLSLGGATVNNSRIRVRNISGNNNALGFFNLSNATDLEVDGILCGPHATATRGLIDINAGPLVNIALRNINFANQPALTGSNHQIFDNGLVTGRYEVDGVFSSGTSGHAFTFGSRVTARNLTAISTGSDPAIQNTGGTGLSIFQNILVDSAVRGFYTSTPVEIDGMKLIGCSSTLASMQFDTGSSNSIVRNVTVQQGVSIPGGAVGLFFNTVPRVVQNVLCISAGTDYTAANSINFSVGTAGTQTRGLTPNPFSASATIAPGLLTNGTATNGTVAIPGAAFGDKVIAGPGADSQGMTYSVEVSSAGNARWVISNTSGVSLTWASSTWTFSIEKG